LARESEKLQQVSFLLSFKGFHNIFTNLLARSSFFTSFELFFLSSFTDFSPSSSCFQIFTIFLSFSSKPRGFPKVALLGTFPDCFLVTHSLPAFEENLKAKYCRARGESESSL
jgi:hypothetical protein